MNFTDLILVVGTNPLPNYVAVSFLGRENPSLQRVWLICSEEKREIGQKGTGEFAENLKDVLILQNAGVDFEETVFVENVNEKRSIEKAAESILKRLRDLKVTNAHLFYTGGTKSEVVHFYNFFHSNDSGVNFTFSYLSARDFRLYFDDNEKVSPDLRGLVSISFKNLCKLHSFDIKGSSEENEDIYQDALARLDSFIQNGKIEEFFNPDNGYNREFFEDKKGDLADKIKKIADRDRLKNVEFNDVFLEVCNAFPEEYRLFENGKFNEHLENKKFKAIVKNFLDGKWFELYLKKVLMDKKDVVCFDEILTNQEPRKEDNMFELDVVLVKGYQLVGISCTTSDSKYLCKSKGFEIILRNRQIGGAEAKAILVTKANSKNTDILQKELILTTGTSQENILVLGFEDWKREMLIEKIDNFLNWRLL